jgi:two-component system chemotaxis sensor kinase CheA
VNGTPYPEVSLLELVRLDAERAAREIERMHDVPVYRLRGRLLPLLYLREQLKLEHPNARRDVAEEAVSIVVLQAEDRQFGLMVDHIEDTQEIVVKPLEQHLKGIASYAGATIMGDGTVALILDVIGLARQGNVLSEQCERALSDGTNSTGGGNRPRHSFLIVDPGDGSRAAIPLVAVSRLEEVPRCQIEYVGRQEVVQYRGRIMPLVPLSTHRGYGVQRHGHEGDMSGGPVPVVVYSRAEHIVGVAVGRIVDIVWDDGPVASHPDARVIAERVTQIVDLDAVVQHALPELRDKFTAA